MHLIDYRVRILHPQDASAAQTRVRIESAMIDTPEENWFTLGVSTNIIEASYRVAGQLHLLLDAG